MTTYGLEQLTSMRGTSVYSVDDERIGAVDEIYVDEQTGQPEWIGLGMGLFGAKRVLVPVQGAEPADDGLRVPYTKDAVRDMPAVDPERISEEDEARMHRHYSLEYSHAPASRNPAGGRSRRVNVGPEDEATVTRSEEELKVGKREIEVGRLRLHKWTETEQVNVPVEVRREKARVTREPVEGTVSDEAIAEEALEVTLREEEPVVEKQTVAKERIRLEKDVETDTETVTGELRKERVGVEGDAEQRVGHGWTTEERVDVEADVQQRVGRRSASARGDERPTREELYAEARRLGIEGRSKMNKAELAQAVEERRGSGGAAGESARRTTDKANPIEVQKFLEAVDYPTRKGDLVRAAVRQGAPEEVRATLERIRDKKFNDPTDVSEAIGRLS
jgi:uncharacterized protein (TIGR02271 family)